MSAYACEPGRGSEPGAGWAWACAAARDHEVWVLTHATNRATVVTAVAADPHLAERLHPVFLQNPRPVRLLRRGPARFLYYLIWQLTTCRTAARRLHVEVGFDVCHHVTYAADWMPAGATLSGVPLVWGPVGGSSTTGGLRGWRLLGPRAAVVEMVRAVALGAARRLVGHPVARRAAVVLGQNPDVAAAFRSAPVVVQPNVAVEPAADAERSPRGNTAVFAGRLLPWKGLRPALEALTRPAAAGWRLDVYGDGPDRASLQRRVAELGLGARVRFLGSCPRTEFRAALAAADVFLFPSLHDAAGWSVAEAMAAGCPVLCLDTGGPATLVGPGDGVVVPLHGDVVGALAEGLDRARALRPDERRWSAERLPAVLDAVYADALAGSDTEAKAS